MTTETTDNADARRVAEFERLVHELMYASWNDGLEPDDRARRLVNEAKNDVLNAFRAILDALTTAQRECERLRQVIADEDREIIGDREACLEAESACAAEIAKNQQQRIAALERELGAETRYKERANMMLEIAENAKVELGAKLAQYDTPALADVGGLLERLVHATLDASGVQRPVLPHPKVTDMLHKLADAIKVLSFKHDSRELSELLYFTDRLGDHHPNRFCRICITHQKSPDNADHKESCTARGIEQLFAAERAARERVERAIADARRMEQILPIGNELIRRALAAGSGGEQRIYPCDKCGTMRTKAEGGTVFTVCDDCWSELHPDTAQGGR